MKKGHKNFLAGFTLVELMIVVGILAVLLTITLVAVNPFEQLNRASDVSKKSVVKDLADATKYYFTSTKTVPWKKNSSCKDELLKEQTLDQMPSCVEEIANNAQLQTKVVASNDAKDIYVSECNNGLAVCYSPKSKTFNQSSEARYTKGGRMNPNCPSSNGTSSDCYVCNFTTNEAQECFEALNPNGTLAYNSSAPPTEVVPVPNRHSEKTCAEPEPGKASCMGTVVTDSKGNPLSSLGLPAGLGPEQFHLAYNLPCTPGGAVQTVCNTPTTFGPQTIAIIIAFHTPTIESDLIYYSNRYGIPTCSKANGCLTIVNQTGGSTLPITQNESWSLEASMDVQVAHAVCQTCKILLVEANSNSFLDLATAVNTAAQLGATTISNSYGANEFSNETTYDSYYRHLGVYVVASSGDNGYGVLYPASSKDVISVGGTTLHLLANNTYSSESVWSGAGSGCSPYQTANSFQTAVSNWFSTGCGAKRGATDVSAVADPRTGAAIYDGSGYSGSYGWWVVGGTSLSSPVVGAALALAAPPPTDQPAAAYIYANPSKFRDVTTGSNGSCGGSSMCTAAVGYDGPTGIGTPNLLSAANVTFPPLSPSPTPTTVPNPASSQVWISSYWNIYRFNTDGTMANNFIAKPSDGLAVVGNEVWVANGSANSIYRYNFDGSKTKADLTGNGMDRPRRLAVVGNQVWVINTDGANPANSISRFNFDGTSAGSTITGNGLCQPMYLAVVGNQVWVTNYNWYAGCSASTNGTISRFNLDGSPAGAMLTGNGMYGLYGISVVGQEVWVANYKNNNLSRFHFDGTVAGAAISGNSLDHPTFIGIVGNKVWVGNDNYSYSYAISQFNFDGTSGGSTITYPQINNVNTPFDIAVIQGLGASSSEPTAAPTITPIPTPTPSPIITCGSTMQTVSLAQSDPQIALPGDTVNNTLVVKNNDPANCSMTYTISYGYPTGFTLNGIPSSFTLTGGQTKSIPFTIGVPANKAAGNYPYSFYVAKQGQSTLTPVNGSIQVAQVGPTNTPTPTPVVCNVSWTNSLGSTSMSANAGDTLQETLTITNTSSASCNSFQFTISYAYPSGWVINNLPASVTLSPGQSTTIPFTIGVSTGAQIQDYTLQFWPQFGSFSNPNIPLNATVHVLSTGQPPQQQMFSNFNPKMYGNYALFEYSYNATGAVGARLDVATDPSLLNQTSGSSPNARYYFAGNSGSAMDASNKPTPTTVEGLIVSSPTSWSGWQCGKTIYYRIYNSGDLRIASPILSGVVDCTTVINVLPWDGWYAAIYQGVYDGRYDADNNGKIDYVDYWILVRATRLR